MGKKFDPKAALLKQGWSEGSGLGRNSNGISEPIKAVLKHDFAGVGHDAGEQFTNCWWQQLFNKSASNINVSTEEDNITISQAQPGMESKLRKFSNIMPSGKSNLYSTFVKTATLHGSEEIRNLDLEKFPVGEANNKTQVFSDEVLHSACGGRTAHKGARHGLKMNGKLERIMRQEKTLHKEQSISTANLYDISNKTEDKDLFSSNVISKKKSKKYKETNISTSENFSDCYINQEDMNNMTENKETFTCSDNVSSKKSKKRKRTDSLFAESSIDQEDRGNRTEELEEVLMKTDSVSCKKLKKHKTKDNFITDCTSMDIKLDNTNHTIEQLCDEKTETLAEKKKIKKKNKLSPKTSFENNCNECSNDAVIDNTESVDLSEKKIKKKSKQFVSNWESSQNYSENTDSIDTNENMESITTSSKNTKKKNSNHKVNNDHDLLQNNNEIIVATEINIGFEGSKKKKKKHAIL